MSKGAGGATAGGRGGRVGSMREQDLTAGPSENPADYARIPVFIDSPDPNRPGKKKSTYWSDVYFGDWWRGLTKQEQAANSLYHSVNYWKYNEFLRTGNYQAEKNLTDNMIKHYDSALAKGSLPFSATVWRGANTESIYQRVQNKSLRPGEVISDAGYTSTSPREDEATRYMRMGTPSFMNPAGTNFPILYRVLLPKGSPMGAVNHTEIVLPRGGQFKVISAELQPGHDANLPEAHVTVLYLGPKGKTPAE